MEKFSAKEREELILGIVEDLVADFLYYDRKEDEELPRGEIEAALKKRPDFVFDIINKFAAEIKMNGFS